MINSEIQPARLFQSQLLTQDGFNINKLSFLVPLDHSQPSGPTIRLSAAVVCGDANTPAPRLGGRYNLTNKPFLVYLVGGPGAENSATRLPYLNTFALAKGYQILYLDYRGTGESTPVTVGGMLTTLGQDTKKQAQYLQLFRQDNVVRDLEALRRRLASEIKELGWDYGGDRTGAMKWSLFGQSYGGWVALSYLSMYPENLSEVFSTGGLAPVGRTAEEVYRATYRRVIASNREYYERYPEDVGRIHHLVQYISDSKPGHIALPGSGRLTAQQFLCLGRELGVTGGMQRIHSLVKKMATEIYHRGRFSPATLAEVEGWVKFDARPLYAVLHEAIYCSGTASRWAAVRVGQSLDEFFWLRPGALARGSEKSVPLYMAGEAVYPFHFDTYAGLRGLKEVANLLAKHDGWVSLYDEEQLRRNEVPIYAIIYKKDMFVDLSLSRETASKLNNIRVHESEHLLHTAVRDRPQEVLSELWKLRGNHSIV